LFEVGYGPILAYIFRTTRKFTRSLEPIIPSIKDTVKDFALIYRYRWPRDGGGGPKAGDCALNRPLLPRAI
jgi:hypothetical protein